MFYMLHFFTQAATGQEECVEALLQRGASICVRDIRGRSPLHLASACGRVGPLAALLQATNSSHTQTHLTDNQGYTPLHWACYNGTEALETHHFCSCLKQKSVCDSIYIIFSSLSLFRI